MCCTWKSSADSTYTLMPATHKLSTQRSKPAPAKTDILFNIFLKKSTRITIFFLTLSKNDINSLKNDIWAYLWNTIKCLDLQELNDFSVLFCCIHFIAEVGLLLVLIVFSVFHFGLIHFCRNIFRFITKRHLIEQQQQKSKTMHRKPNLSFYGLFFQIRFFFY